jgi:hypothetical protein
MCTTCECTTYTCIMSTELLEAHQFTIGQSLGISTKIQCTYANALIVRIIKVQLSDI